MGYKRKRTILELKFEGEPDLVIYARSCSVRRFLWVLKVADAMTGGSLPQGELDEFVGWFASRITGWNIEDDDGSPVPVSADYLLEEDIDWAAKVVMGWVSGVLKVFRFPTELGQLAQLAETARQGGGTVPDPAMAAAGEMSRATPDSATGM